LRLHLPWRYAFFSQQPFGWDFIVVVKKTFRYSNVFLTTTYTIRKVIMKSGIDIESRNAQLATRNTQHAARKGLKWNLNFVLRAGFCSAFQFS
jgi:hypothetical protein